MSQHGKFYKQGYYRNINTLNLCRPVLLSSNFQSEHVAAGENFKQRYYRNIKNFSICRPVLLSGNVQFQHVAKVESLQAKILLEH